MRSGDVTVFRADEVKALITRQGPENEFGKISYHNERREEEKSGY
jgi:hypothetical protein